VGWAELQTSGTVSGFAVFQQLSPGSSLQEAVVPLETRTPNSFVLAYNNTNGYVTTAAVANLASQTANIGVVIRDGTGLILQSTTITVPPLGHLDFAVPTNFPTTAGRLGTVEFQVPIGGQISVLGLRFDPAAAFSTIPLMVK
jgi:hypothetical protein